MLMSQLLISCVVGHEASYVRRCARHCTYVRVGSVVYYLAPGTSYVRTMFSKWGVYVGR